MYFLKNSRHKETFTLEEFAEHAEECGLLAFGEPYANYSIKHGQEYLTFYLTYPTHGVQSELAIATLAPDERSKRLMLYGNDEDQTSVDGLLLTECLKQFGNRFIEDTGIQYDILNDAALAVGNHSNKKKLTYVLANSILDQDVVTLGAVENAGGRVADFINQNTETITRPEEVAYISRLELSLQEKNECLNFPLQWLARAYLPGHPFASITLPKTPLSSYDIRERVRVS